MENTKMPMTGPNLPLSKTCTKCGQIFEALKDAPQMTHPPADLDLSQPTPKPRPEGLCEIHPLCKLKTKEN